jgi:hypothetical protein
MRGRPFSGTHFALPSVTCGGAYARSRRRVFPGMAAGAIATRSLVDGDVAESETRFVDPLKAALTIDDEVAARVIDVLVMKSRV